MNQLHLYHAAAGAGKTHALVRYYLTQALQHPTAFHHILAITFTNKATQEMKERILTSLHHIAQGKDPALAQELQATLACSLVDIQKRSHHLLEKIIHDYHHFHVTTIDSLFNTLIRAFHRELRIHPTYTLELDTQHLLTISIEELFSTLSHHPPLKKYLFKWAQSQLQKGLQWDVTPHIIKLAHHLLQRENSQKQPSTHAPDPPPTYDKANPILLQLAKEAQQFQDELTQKATHIYTSIQRQNLPPTHFLWGQRGILGYIQKLKNKLITPPTPRVYQATQSHWLRKDSPHYTTTLPLVAKEWRPLLLDLVHYYHQHSQAYHTTQVLEKLHYASALTQRIHHLLTHHPTHPHQLIMPHLPRLLSPLIHHTAPTLLYAKLGTTYHHLLIDEFQDVSQSQWHHLAPLLRHALQQGASSILVGDVKQALYRWRGSDPTIFLTQVEDDIGAHRIDHHQLPFNWRSQREIIQFNNQFFTHAANHLHDTLATQIRNEVADKAEQADLCASLQPIKEAYAHTEQKIPTSLKKQPSRGHVHIRLLSAPQDPPSPYRWKKQAIQQTIQQIETLQKAGYAPSDIAILVRDHAEGQQILQALMEQQKSATRHPQVSYQAKASNGIPLANHPTIALLITALNYLQKPHPKSQLATLLHLYAIHHKKRKNTPHPHTYLSSIHDEKRLHHHLPPSFVHHIDSLVQLPLYHLLIRLIEIFQLDHPTATPYLEVFQDHLHSYLAGGQTSLTDFLADWEKNGKKLTLPPSATPHTLTISTIHQAKGLAYPVVLIPFCAWALDHPHRATPILWCQTPIQPFHELGSIPLYYQQDLKSTYYRHAYYQERWQVHLEQLNLLYVAFTRAKERLYILAPQTSPSHAMTSVAHLLPKVLFQTHGSPSQDNEWHIGAPTAPIAPTGPPMHQPAATPPSLCASSTHAERAWQSVSPPPHELGHWWHAFFESIQHMEDFQTVLQRQLQRGQIKEEQAHTIQQKIKKWSQDTRFATWFSGRYQIKAEKPILLRNGKTLRPDRVMIDEKEAIILDFKTGKAAQSHHEQLMTYAHWLRQIGYSPISAYLFYISLDRIVPVRTSS